LLVLLDLTLTVPTLLALVTLVKRSPARKIKGLFLCV
jgi:hypothetical protein